MLSMIGYKSSFILGVDNKAFDEAFLISFSILIFSILKIFQALYNASGTPTGDKGRRGSAGAEGKS